MTLKGKKIVIIHPNPIKQGILSLCDSGASVYLLTKEITMHHELLTVIEVNDFEIEGIEAIVSQLNHEAEIDAVLPIWEGVVIETAIIAAKLGLRTNNVKSAIMSRDKYLMAKQLLLNGVHTPKTQKVDHVNQATLLLSSFKFPLVLKLPSSTNSQSVTRVNNVKELEEAYEQIESMYTSKNRLWNIYQENTIGSVIIQEYIEGIEVNIDLIYNEDNLRVLGIFEKAPMQGPYFAEYRSVYPTSLSDEQIRMCVEAAEKAVRAIGATIGCAHVELRYSSDGPVIIELALRPGGAYTSLAIENISNVNVYKDLATLLVNGKLPEVNTNEKKACLYGGVEIKNEGYISHILGTEIFEFIEELVDFKVLHNVGDYVRPLPLGSDIHIVHYLMVGNDLNILLKKEKIINENIKVEIMKGEKSVSDNRNSKESLHT